MGKGKGFMSKLAKMIQTRRLKMGMGKTALARSLGVEHKGFIDRIESGLRKVPVTFFRPLADVLGYNVHDLIDAYLEDKRQEIFKELHILTDKTPSVSTTAKVKKTEDGDLCGLV